MKLASIEIITEINPHPNADRLSLAKVLGYICIVVKDEFKVGDAVVLIQPDTVLPDKPWAEMFKKRGNRVKAMKIRGVFSFGIVMSPYVIFAEDIGRLKFFLMPSEIGKDISEHIGVFKYEAPLPKALDAKGSMPFGLPKTDEYRWQLITDLPFGETVDVSLKKDGSSGSFYCKKIPGHMLLTQDEDLWVTGICSRSLELKPDCHNNYTAVEKKYDILRKLKDYCLEHNVSLALRGEITGFGIQSHKNNPHSQMSLDFAVFSVFNLDTMEYEHKGSKHYYLNVAEALNIPVVDQIGAFKLTPELIKYYAEDISELNGKPFEGVVIKHSKGSFKVINLAYDEKK